MTIALVGRLSVIGLTLTLAACATQVPAPASDVQVTNRAAPDYEDARFPAFATKPYQPFSRAEAVAIAVREWRMWGEPVDDLPPNDGPPPTDDASNPARAPGMWERVGEYWWFGVNPSQRASRWTGKHDSDGDEYPASSRGAYPWSAAFISYVMRIAGAGDRFPYSPSHATYIDAAVRNNSGWAVVAHPIDAYAPQLGDIICAGREDGKRIRFRDLPRSFPAHCEIVTSISPGQISAISGNVDAAVTLTHIPILSDGRLGDASDEPLDDRYRWIAVLQVLYDQ
jgi:hypothetical protein